MRSLMTVHIEVDGQWPTDKELENRNAIISELSERNLGKFIRAGSSAGSMDFSYEVHDTSAAEVEIRREVFKHLPGYKHTTQTTARKASLQAGIAQDVKAQQRQAPDTPKLDFGMGM